MYLRNLYVRFLSNGITFLFSFSVYVLIVKSYGVKALGSFYLAYSSISIFGAFTDLGLSTAIIKFVAEAFEDKLHLKTVISTYFFLKLFFVSILVIVIISLYKYNFLG